MQHKIYQVDAFTDGVFPGNPAAVCPLTEWLEDELLQQIALENNLAETAFYVKRGDEYQLRWFTPKVEVDLCEHATLAAAYVLFNYEQHTGTVIHFYSYRAGNIVVTRDKELLTLNFPAGTGEALASSVALTRSFDCFPVGAMKGKTDYVLLFENEDQVKNIKANLPQIAMLGGRGVIVTAKGHTVDFVSRFFEPLSGIDEDTVSGAAHTILTPYWAKELGKTALTAIQLSARRGYLQCKLLGDRVEISGQAKLFIKEEV